MASSHIALGFLFLMLSASVPLFALKYVDDFDFYYLILLWPGAYCGQSKCCLPKNGHTPKVDFFVQGFQTWKQDDEPVTRCNSTDSHFDFNKLNDLTDGLYDYWNNIKCPRNDGKKSWKQAWENYGVCSGFTQDKYFQAALQLRSEANLLKHLADQGITPSATNSYSVSDIKTAITEGTGVEPLIRCSYKKHTKLFQLYQVYLCVDSTGKTLIDCPVKQRFTCSDKILFLPFDTNQLNATVTLTAAAADDEGILKMVV